MSFLPLQEVAKLKHLSPHQQWTRHTPSLPPQEGAYPMPPLSIQGEGMLSPPLQFQERVSSITRLPHQEGAKPTAYSHL